MRRFNSIEMHIDAENATAKKIGAVISRVAKYGDIRANHCYADFSNPSVKPWLDASNEYSIIPHQASRVISGKNTSDFELVSNCLGSMYRGKTDLIVVVSSDSDFTSTVRKLREAGIYTIGVGERKTPRAFQNAYNEFWFLDEFVSNNNLSEKKSRNIASFSKNNKNQETKAAKKIKLEDIVAREINKLQMKLRRNWILVATLGVELKNRGIEFNTGLNDFVRNHERFILTKDKDTDAWLVTVNRDY